MGLAKELISLFLILILVYLLVKNSDGTDKVIRAISSGVEGVTNTLQGNGQTTALN